MNKDCNHRRRGGKVDYNYSENKHPDDGGLEKTEKSVHTYGLMFSLNSTLSHAATPHHLKKVNR